MQNLVTVFGGSGFIGTQVVRRLAKRGWRVRVAVRHDEALAHRIPASADVVLVPSWYEPCGLVQMYAMRYGAVPVVFPTGGLRDSVVPHDEAAGTGTGFWMERHDAAALVEAVASALGLWRRTDSWRILQRNGMRADFSWREPASRYLEIYRRVVEASS